MSIISLLFVFPPYYLWSIYVYSVLLSYLPRIDGGFDDSVCATGEQVVGFQNAAEGKTMGYQMSSVNFAFGNQLHNFVAVAGIYTTCLECEILAIHPRQRQYLLLLIQRDNRNDGIRSGTTPCEFKSILTSCNLNHPIGTTTLCQ